MNYTFSRVAAFCGLRLSYYITAALLAASFLVLTFTEYRIASPLYILLCLAVLPSILKAMLFSKETKRENELTFPLFCQKYHYNTAIYKAMNLSYFLILILFAAWHFSYTLGSDKPGIITQLPFLLAAASLLVRLLGVIGYRLYFHLFPLKAMH